MTNPSWRPLRPRSKPPIWFTNLSYHLCGRYISHRGGLLEALRACLKSSMSLSSLPDRHSMDHSDASSNSSPDSFTETRVERRASRRQSRSESLQPPPPPPPRKPIPRKGHTKSRRGCYNCKRRRIKCNERHPECNHCIKAGLRCEYPANIIQTTQLSPSSPHPQEMVNLRSIPGVFVSSWYNISSSV